jgi:hypothetical protein
MRKNQSDTERFIRIIIGGALLLAGTYVPMNGILSWALMLLGLVLMLTGLAGYCPCYGLLGMSSNK